MAEQSLNRLYATPKLSELRSKRFSHNEIASLVKMSLGRDFTRSAYSHIESGAHGTVIDTAVAIARVLNADVSEIFSTQPTKPAKPREEKPKDDRKPIPAESTDFASLE